MMTKEAIGFNGITADTTDGFIRPARRFDSYSGSRQSARAMRSAFWFVVLVVLALGACGSRAPADGATAGGGAGEWVCRPDGETWDCAEGAEAPPAESERE